MHMYFGRGTVIEVGKKYGIKKMIKNHESIKKI